MDFLDFAIPYQIEQRQIVSIIRNMMKMICFRGNRGEEDCINICGVGEPGYLYRLTRHVDLEVNGILFQINCLEISASSISSLLG